MNSPSAAVETELRAALSANTGNLGRVYLLLQEGVTSNAKLVEARAAANSGAVSNIKAIIKAILTGECPSAPSIAGQAGRTIGGIVRTNPGLSAGSRQYLADLRAVLDEHSQDTEAVEREDRELEAASDNLERAIADLDGVYVYTYPTYFRTVQKTDPERFLYKVGKTERFSGQRIEEQQRATNMPEDPWTLRVYRSAALTPDQLEDRFHAILEAAGHGHSLGMRSGKEWFFTNLEFLDGVASLLECEVHKPVETE